MAPELPVTRLPFPPVQTLVITGRDTMPEAIRKSLLGQLQIMLSHEGTARLGTDPEGVHQMRVATRRIRSLYKAFDHLLDENFSSGISDNLKHTARVLGAVRDLDVFIANTRQYMGKKKGEERASLDNLLDVLEEQQLHARADLIAWLDSEDYLRFVFHFFDALKLNATTAHLPGPSSPEKPVSYEVRHVLPGIIHEQFRQVRQYEAILPSTDVPTLHRLRINCKELRYTLDAFGGVLGRRSGKVIKGVKNLQTYLGDMNDASVAAQRIDTLIEEHPSLASPAVDAYRQYYTARCNQFVRGFPTIWRKFNNYRVRRRLALALAVP